MIEELILFYAEKKNKSKSATKSLNHEGKRKITTPEGVP
jgi:hypothetical protein